ncbi:MAG: copper chaperone PCu(A)C [Actinobacteria bacterium]|nr:copper chaperone PCu(A)C [Actinomycetota bacterium]NCV81346.1 copper chaperone PCu(A)C [Actinomycetota bacterium]NCV97922.1 copper chaperone PCu(A)C [Actinomycetota bacterium]NCW23470.1 copper chaperone PCu(A)C [Actinomycetota bacterium]NCW95869.1 copper chaperone PCu(A)C [Actinomycetota bacterium]
MRKISLLFLTIPLLLTGCASPGGVVAEDLWVKSSEMSMQGGMTAVYGTLTNNTQQDVVLVGGETEIAGVVGVHEMTMIGGEMKMREIDGGLTIPAGMSIVLEPGGNHLMLMMLTDDLEAGEEISVTFDFDGAEDITVDGIVAKPAEGGDEDYHSGEMEMDS